MATRPRSRSPFGRPSPLLLSLLLGACAYIGDADEKARLDPDGDGVLFPNDCDDDDAQRGEPEVFYEDLDGDGFGDAEAELTACTLPDGAVRDDRDCDDSTPDVFPGAQEVPYDGIDQDCDNTDITDVDGDGYPSTAVSGGDDCDDADPDIHPTAEDDWYDGVDADCAGNDDFDQDGDGYTSDLYGGPDCDDTDASRLPTSGVEEVYYNGFDENCDSLADGDGDWDGDGFWADDYEARVAASGETIEVNIPPGDRDCWDEGSVTPSAYTAINGFPQPPVEAVYPGAPDTYYDGVDADCGGDDDFDADQDSYNSDTWPDRAGFIGPDCDDADPSISPAEPYDPPYDGVDQDCAGDSDYDADRDGFDASDWSGTDCDDTLSSVNPSESEICNNGLDDDCSGDDNTCGFDNSQSVAQADAELFGDNDYAGFGDTIEGGDLDGDGRGDAIIGSPYLKSVYTGWNTGGVQLFYGPLSASGRTASLSLYADNDNDYVGDALSEGVDIDADGYEDLAVGAQYVSSGAYYSGTVYLLNGPLGSGSGRLSDYHQLYWHSDYDQMGRIVDTRGDLDGDGHEDLLVGSSGAVGSGGYGRAVIVSGPDTYTGNSRDYIYDLPWVADVQGDYTTTAFAAAADTSGDLTGDGIDDLVITDPSATDFTGAKVGQVFIFAGPLSGSYVASDYDAAVTGVEAYANAGETIAAGGDYDGDGYNDLALGAPYSNGGAYQGGAAFMTLGPFSVGAQTVNDADASVYGVTSYGYLGEALESQADSDGAGQDDLLIGVPSSAGAVLVFLTGLSGALSPSDATATLRGSGSADAIGAELGVVGDLSGDGRPDLLLGSPYRDSALSTASSEGSAFLFLGGSL
jgi:hypothetical protein